MRFLHLADLHLGRTVNEYRLIEDQEYILKEILSIAEEKQADAVVIAGDVYDKSIPSEEAVRLLDWFLSELAKRQIAVILIAGNHDSDVRLDFGSAFFTARNVFITGSYQGAVNCITLQDEFGDVCFWSLPFVKASHVLHYHNMYMFYLLKLLPYQVPHYELFQHEILL